MERRWVWWSLAAVSLLLILTFFLGRNGIAGYLAERWIVRTLGATAVMSDVRAGWGFERIEIDHLTVHEPEETEWATQVASVTGEMAPFGLFRGTLHFRTVNLTITEAVVSRDDRQFKLLHLAPLQPAECKIDRLDWSLERVKLIDVRANPPRVRTIPVRLKRSDTGIESLQQLEKLLLDTIVKTGAFHETEKTEKNKGNGESGGGQFQSGLKRATDKVKAFFRKTFKKE